MQIEVITLINKINIIQIPLFTQPKDYYHYIHNGFQNFFYQILFLENYFSF